MADKPISHQVLPPIAMGAIALGAIGAIPLPDLVITFAFAYYVMKYVRMI